MRRIAFRVDASVEIGTGHLLRCLALAQELQARGAEVAFLCRDVDGNLFSRIRSTPGAKLFPLPRPAGPASGQPYPHSRWLNTSQENDAADSLAALSENSFSADAIVVDHYALGAPWEERMGAKIKTVFVIDDLADRPHNCDFLLDQNFSSRPESRYEGLLPQKCRALLGPRYALLRPEFAEKRSGLRAAENAVAKKLLIFFGGTDPGGETLKALAAIALLPQGDFETTVLIGKNNFRREEIERRSRELPGTACIFDAPNIAGLMLSADLFLGSGGTTSWERCCLGLPSVVVAIATNQVELSEELARQGYVIFLGEAAKVSPQDISAALGFLRGQGALRQNMATIGGKLVDGRGVERIASILAPQPIELRPATPADSDSIFTWRNAEETRRYFFDPRPISPEGHRAWFAKTLANPDSPLLIGFREGTPVGVLRYDISAEEAKVSIYLVPGQNKGAGVGSELLRAGHGWLRKQRPEITSVLAEVLPQNHASQGAFRNAGYEAEQTIYRHQLGKTP